MHGVRVQLAERLLEGSCGYVHTPPSAGDICFNSPSVHVPLQDWPCLLLFYYLCDSSPYRHVYLSLSAPCLPHDFHLSVAYCDYSVHMASKYDSLLIK
jgi:hypothetical protein